MKNSFYNIFISIAIIILFIVIGFYYFNFKQFGLSEDQAIWGSFGDFIGGTLNPIFALLSFIALLSTIRLQSEELRLTREELEKSSTALVEQSNSFKIQNDSIKQQNFENTFFKMIDLHNEIVNNLILTQIKAIMPDYRVGSTDNKYVTQNYFINESNTGIVDGKDYFSKKAIVKLLEVFTAFCHLKGSHEINILYDEFHNEYREIIGHYFGNIYQILKFINESGIEDKKRYSSLYRAQFSVSEIELLSYHCISKVAVEQFKPLIEKYQFLEHIKNTKMVKEIRKFYDNKAFGNNY